MKSLASGLNLASHPKNPDHKIKGSTYKEVPHIEDANILVIEDEVLYSALIGRYLEDLPKLCRTYNIKMPEDDFKVHFLQSGWDLLSMDLKPLRVVITDLLLPQVTGVELCKHFRKFYPHVGIVPISGMATEPMKRQLRELLPEGFKLLDKPLKKEAFHDALVGALIFFENSQHQTHEPDASFGDEPLWSESITNTEALNVSYRRKPPKFKKASNDTS